MNARRPRTFSLSPALSPAIVAALLLVTSGMTSGASLADDDAARRAAVIVKAGSHALTVGELEDRLAGMPRAQLEMFGHDAATIRRTFVDEVVARDLLLAAGADEKHLDKELSTAQRIERTKAQATLRAVRAKVGPASAIAMEDVQKFYDENRAKYDAPERINVWRIVCKTRDEADAVLAAAKKDATPKTFEKLAREHSLDKGTYLRGGNLGFLMPDGASNEAGLKVDPAIPKAAADVKNGELVPQPVKEGESWSVVWRRGSIAPSRRTVEEASSQIRDVLWKQRVDEASKKLQADLRATKVHDVNYDLLTTIDVPAAEGAVLGRKRPGQLAPAQPPPPPQASSANPK